MLHSRRQAGVGAVRSLVKLCFLVRSVGSNAPFAAALPGLLQTRARGKRRRVVAGCYRGGMQMPPLLKLVVIILNGLAVLAGIALLCIGAFYAPDGSWGTSSAVITLALLFPCFMALAALVMTTSPGLRSVAYSSAVAWLVPLLFIGLMVAMGLGGFAGALIVIVPIAMLLLLNCVALKAQARREAQ